jgi:excisionase family DNA binding protein
MSDYLTTAEVAAIIRKSPDYVSRQCALGNLRAKKLGNDWRIHRTSVDAFMAQGVAPATRPRRRAS